MFVTSFKSSSDTIVRKVSGGGIVTIVGPKYWSKLKTL